MNEREQKDHRKVTHDLARRIDDQDVVIVALDERLSAVANAAHQELQGAHLGLQERLDNEIRAREDADHRLRESVRRHEQALASLNFWRMQSGWAGLRNRLMWLVSGRSASS